MVMRERGRRKQFQWNNKSTTGLTTLLFTSTRMSSLIAVEQKPRFWFPRTLAKPHFPWMTYTTHMHTPFLGLGENVFLSRPSSPTDTQTSKVVRFSFT